MGRNSKKDTIVVSKPAQYKLKPTKSFHTTMTFPEMESAVAYMKNRDALYNLSEEQMQQRIKEMIEIVEPVYKKEKVLASVA